jgi:hypothetical protein
MSWKTPIIFPSLAENDGPLIPRNFCHTLSMRFALTLFSLVLVATTAYGVPTRELTSHIDSLGEFSGRISMVNQEAALMRLKVDFNNLKYLNPRDRVEFWDQSMHSRRCSAFVVGKSNDYLLLRVPSMEFCDRYMMMVPGTFLRFFSQDLVNNLKMGEELVGILLKRRMALQGMVSRGEAEMAAHLEKVNAVNARYEVLRQKLMLEWRNEIGNLEEDRTVSLRNLENARSQLNEVDKKLEVYRIDDDNLRQDRWALDPRLYLRK